LNDTTKARFRKKLLADIDSLCKVSDELFLKEDGLDRIFEQYQRYRAVIHEKINLNSEKEAPKMDRHKIAAAFFCAILKAEPIGKTPNADKFFERTVNEQLALIFSVLYVIDTFNVSNKNNTKMDKAVYELYIKLPECLQSEMKDYTTNFIMLFDEEQKEILDIDSEKFKPGSLFIISHIFFLLDSYSYEKNRCLIMDSGFTPSRETT